MEYEICDQKLQKIRDELYNCILKEYKEDLMLILKQTNNASSYVVLIRMKSLTLFCPTALPELLRNPEVIFIHADSAAIQVQEQLYEEERGQNPDLSLKRNLHVRLRTDSIDTSSPLFVHQFPDYSASGEYVVLDGIVAKTKPMQTIQFRKPYRCSKCQRTAKYEALVSNFYRYPPETLLKCETCCVSTPFKLVSTMEVEELSMNEDLRDYQEIKIQENLNGFQGAVNSKVYTVILEEDLVNTCNPGDQVYVGGWLSTRFKAFLEGSRIEGQIVLKANHVTVTNLDHQRECVPTEEQINEFQNFWKTHTNNPLLGRDCLLRSFCSEVDGIFPVKLTLLVAIVGGADSNSTEMKDRSNSHVLLVGDSGGVMSKLLHYSSKLVSRSAYRNVYASSAFDLTVGKDQDLQTGAQVIARSSLYCIDGFTLLQEEEMATIHEAMEQQAISVDKAGIMCTLNVNCTVIAAANLKSITKRAGNRFDVDIGHKSSILSRFDVAMLLVDNRNPEADGFADFSQGLQPCVTSEPWDLEKLKTYIAYVKKLDVQISDDASKVLVKYYMYQRRTQKDRSITISPRFLKSLKRLTQGHAKLMFRNQAIVIDAIAALSIVEHSLNATNILGMTSNSVSHVSFPDDVLKDYRDTAKQMLNFLGLTSIWRKEENWLSMISSGDNQISVDEHHGFSATQEVSNERMEDEELEQEDSGLSNEIVTLSFPDGSSDP